MSPIRYPRSGPRTTCRIGDDGRFSIPHFIIDDLDWPFGQRFELHYTRSPIIIQLLPGSDGYVLRRLSPGSKPNSGLLTLRGFTNEILKTNVVLPQDNLTSISVPGFEGLILLLSEPNWIEENFSLSGAKNAPTGLIGVYEILDSRGNIIRIGQGIIRSRVSAHLKDDTLAKRGKSFRYAQVEPMEDTEYVERVLLARYAQQNDGSLPLFNSIHA